MSFFEILLLFICFCVVSAVIEIIKLVIQGRIMKAQQNEKVDALLNSLIKGIMKYRLEVARIIKGDNKNA